MQSSKSKQLHHSTESILIRKDPTKQLPVVYNVSSTNYCSLRIKKKFVDRYLLSKQVSENCRNVKSIWRQKIKNEQVNNEHKNPFKVSPIKIHQNSPELIRQRVKTEYPKVRFFRNKVPNQAKSIYKTIAVQFLQKKAILQNKGSKFKISKLRSSIKEGQTSQLVRPMTANQNSKYHAEGGSLRRTKTLQISNLIKTTDGKQQAHYTLNGWQNEVPQYQN